MFYTAGEAAKILGVAPSTLRYYDKEGLLPFVEKTKSGIRMFKEEDFSALRLIQCLKKTGLPLKEIKHFIELPNDGEETIQTRLAILKQQKAILEEKKKELDEMMEVVDYKLWYYNTAEQEGSTQKVMEIVKKEIPHQVKSGYDKLHAFPSSVK